jgi:hypothetical protein
MYFADAGDSHGCLQLQTAMSQSCQSAWSAQVEPPTIEASSSDVLPRRCQTTVGKTRIKEDAHRIKTLDDGDEV